MDPDGAVDREEIAARLAVVAGGVNRRLRPGPGELGTAAGSALASISRCGSVRPGDLARIEGMAAPGMARLLADLEQQGLLSRSPDPDDGRAHRVSLTAAGTALLDQVRARRAGSALELLAAADDQDLAHLAAALDLLEAALVRRPVSAAR